jgi:hypothetical protein
VLEDDYPFHVCPRCGEPLELGQDHASPEAA